MTLRTDHVAGGGFIIFGIVILTLSGDLPVGQLSMPGAGMLPKLVTCFIIILGLTLVLRAGESEPLASVSWSDFPHAARVTAITAAAIALYQTLGFIVTMTLLLFVLVVGTERRHPLIAGVYSIGVVMLTYLLFAVALRTPLDKGIFGF